MNTITCLQCGKEFEDSLSSNRKYCSYGCYYLSMTGRNREKRFCIKCGKEYECFSRENKRYCSYECFNSTRVGIERQCEQCGRIYKTVPSKRKRFCCHKCYSKSLVGRKVENSGKFVKGRTPWNKGMNFEYLERRGENHHWWNGGTSFEPYTRDWTNTLRRSIRERDNYTCQLCGEEQGDVAFSVHHIDYDKANCSPDNLITLCKSCHGKTTLHRDCWKEIFSNLLTNSEND